MEENVALDTSKQKKFVKSIKGIKKLIKKAESGVPEDVVPKAKDEKKPKRKRPDRGLVYLSHIPHGFYEHEMTQYFKQFGAVSNVRVIRSKRTGNSKGCAFVEFKQPAVAEIVAETMNNYLMGKRLIKAAYVPPEKQRPKAMRKHWNRLNNPGRTERLKHKKAYNETKDHAGELARARKTLQTYKKNMKKISDLGINYDFFTPVDIPEELLESNDPQKVAKVASTSKINKETVQKDTKKKDKVDEIKTVTKKDSVKEQKKKLKEQKKVLAEQKNVLAEQKKEGLKKEKKVLEPVVNKKEQKQKQQKLKEEGVKPPENFIKVQDEESDSSADFDSDDYNKALENDSDIETGDDSDESGDENDDSGDESDEGSDQEEDDEPGSDDEFEITGSDDDESEVDESEEEVVLPKKGKSKSGPNAKPAPITSKKLALQLMQATKEVLSKSSKQKGKAKPAEKIPQQKGPKAPELGKRKAPQKIAVSPKKPKFEKQTQQPMKKQFKKKK